MSDIGEVIVPDLHLRLIITPLWQIKSITVPLIKLPRFILQDRQQWRLRKLNLLCFLNCRMRYRRRLHRVPIKLPFLPILVNSLEIKWVLKSSIVTVAINHPLPPDLAILVHLLPRLLPHHVLLGYFLPRQHKPVLHYPVLTVYIINCTIVQLGVSFQIVDEYFVEIPGREDGVVIGVGGGDQFADGVGSFQDYAPLAEELDPVGVGALEELGVLGAVV